MRLSPQPWMTSDAARRVMGALNSARPDCARFVGGCVRNALLGAPVDDIDIATQLTPDVVSKVMLAAGIAAHPTGLEHGTLTVVADRQPFEVTTLRRDVETDGRRATVAFTEDWMEDAQRRDFRMNALYAALDGEVHDPTGGGLDDIARRRIVFVGDPDARIREDYLRILRFFRFFAWYGGGDPDEAGLSACGRLKAGLAGISAERIWMEMKKLLAAPAPAPAIAAMIAASVMAQIFPEAKDAKLLNALVRLEERENLSPDPMLRLQALFNRDAGVLRSLASRLKMSNEERHRLVSSAQADCDLSPGLSGQEIRKALYSVGAGALKDRLMLEWAMRPEHADHWRKLLAAAVQWVRPSMPVSGDDLLALGVAEGPELGRTLRKLERAWIDSDFSLSREALLAEAAG